MEIFASIPDDPEMIQRAAKYIRQAMVTDMRVQDYELKNHPLGWSWPEELPMDCEIKLGRDWGNMMSVEKFLEQY